MKKEQIIKALLSKLKAKGLLNETAVKQFLKEQEGEVLTILYHAPEDMEDDTFDNNVTEEKCEIDYKKGDYKKYKLAIVKKYGKGNWSALSPNVEVYELEDIDEGSPIADIVLAKGKFSLDQMISFLQSGWDDGMRSSLSF